MRIAGRKEGGGMKGETGGMTTDGRIEAADILIEGPSAAPVPWLVDRVVE